MFAKYLLLGEFVPKKLETMEQVWNALNMLEGDRISVLIVAERPPEVESDVSYSGKALVVAGGKDNQYVCTAFIKDEYTATNACNPNVPVSYQEQVWLKRGELESFFKHRILGRDAVSAALDAFVKRGELTDQLIWEPERE